MREAPKCRATEWAKFLSGLAQCATKCCGWSRQTHVTKIDTLVRLFPPLLSCVLVALALVETVTHIYLSLYFHASRSYSNSLQKWHYQYFSSQLSFSHKCPFFVIQILLIGSFHAFPTNSNYEVSSVIMNHSFGSLRPKKVSRSSTLLICA